MDTVLVDGDDEIFICEPFESQSVLIVISFTLDFKIVDGFLGNEFMRADRLVPRSVDKTNVFIEIELFIIEPGNLLCEVNNLSGLIKLADG